ncbi:hypothetical protein [Veillonella ratti]|uniref:hypothetical protein n=1 Tax=Veillonella ratti TaxID=103892 RepID=UPI000F8D563F|nr:hypothetical protein [Veillonella ratti]
MIEKYMGRIVNIEKFQSRGIYLEQGVKGFNQYKYANYPGGNGTYVVGGEYYGVVLNVKIYIFDLKKSITFNVYNNILEFTGKKRISSQLFGKIKSKEGNKVNVYVENGEYSFDFRKLLDL